MTESPIPERIDFQKQIEAVGTWILLAEEIPMIATWLQQNQRTSGPFTISTRHEGKLPILCLDSPTHHYLYVPIRARASKPGINLDPHIYETTVEWTSETGKAVKIVNFEIQDLFVANHEQLHPAVQTIQVTLQWSSFDCVILSSWLKEHAHVQTHTQMNTRWLAETRVPIFLIDGKEYIYIPVFSDIMVDETYQKKLLAAVKSTQIQLINDNFSP